MHERQPNRHPAYRSTDSQISDLNTGFLGPGDPDQFWPPRSGSNRGDFLSAWRPSPQLPRPCILPPVLKTTWTPIVPMTNSNCVKCNRCDNVEWSSYIINNFSPLKEYHGTHDKIRLGDLLFISEWCGGKWYEGLCYRRNFGVLFEGVDWRRLHK